MTFLVNAKNNYTKQTNFYSNRIRKQESYTNCLLAEMDNVTDSRVDMRDRQGQEQEKKHVK